jgi:hypothetical protein
MKILEVIAQAKEFAIKNNIVLELNERAFIDEEHLDVNDYPDDTELMSMKYKEYLVNVYIGSWDSFKEGGKWIDYDIFYNDYELMNDGGDICLTNDVLEAATDIEFYMNKIENIISKKEC